MGTSSGAGQLYLALAVAAGTLFLHLALAVIIPLDPDETYYWEWSRHLAAGYFDHAPLIAVLIRAGTALAGATPLGVRLLPVLAGGIATLAMMVLARRLGGNAAALRSSLVLACMPVTGLLLCLAWPDSGDLAFSAVGLVAVVGAVEAPRGSRRALGWWLLAGLALGAALCSKYTAVLLPLGVFLALVVSPALRPRLAEVGPYLACLVALALFAPVILWNAQHSWLSFGFQLRHGYTRLGGSLLAGELAFIAEQAAFVSPLLFVMVLVVVWRGLRHPHDEKRFVVAVVSLTPLLFFGVSALRRHVEVNWPALAYLPGAVLLATTRGSRAWTRWLYGGCLVGAVSLALLCVHAALPIFLLDMRNAPSGAEGQGWAQAARLVAGARKAAAGGSTWVAANRYQDASELAFYLPDHPVVFSPNLGGRANQYDLWPGFAQSAHLGDGLVLVLDASDGAQAVVEKIKPYFHHVGQAKLVTLRGRAERRLWVCEGWTGYWPDSARVPLAP